jgi:CRISPR/Cas system-associated exonuclease Cas4 (RecB family)
VNANSTLYWSWLDCYEHCGQQFLWYKGWGTIDTGGGRGLPKPPPVKESRHHAVMGLVLAAANERLYNDELVALRKGIGNPALLSERLLEFLDREWFRQLKDPRNHIDWHRAGMTADEMLEVCREGIIGYLRTMKQHRLLGEYAKAEVELIGWIDKWNPVGGRADLIVRREDTGISLLDGKNSRYKDADPDQLRWYALCFLLAYKVMPDRIGFIWYRYPYGKEERDKEGNLVYGEDGEPKIEQGVEWIPFTKEDLQGIAARAVEAKRLMKKEIFEANPVPDYCRNCVFESVCEARQAQRRANAKKNGKDKKLGEIDGEGGFSDFSL